MEVSEWVESGNWSSTHIFYHKGDRTTLILQLIGPLIAELLRRNSIKGFFFVRYSLGGPHVRLRVLPYRREREAVHETIKRAAEEFLTAHPSPSALSDEDVRRVNRALLSQDPNEQDDAIYPDNLCCEVSFRPEMERYGGYDLFVHSVRFFTLSSIRALQIIENSCGSGPARSLAAALTLLRRFAVGFAANSEELHRLVDVPPVANADVTANIVAKADRVFEESKEMFVDLLRNDLVRLTLADLCLDDFEMAACLSWELRFAELPTRIRIFRSHLHMTANRLGLRNSDEIYLMRMLGRSLGAITGTEPQLWSQVQQEMDRRLANGRKPAIRLREILDKSLAKGLEESRA